MNIKVLISKELQNGKKWYLATSNLLEYLESLDDEFFNYDIQRRIVKNSYLDKLWTTIYKGDPLPTITLTADVYNNHSIGKLEILDGLQRTFRLWAIKYLNELTVKSRTQEIGDLISAMRADKNGIRLLDSKIVNRSILRKLIEDDCVNIKSLMECYEQQDVILNIWSGLNDEEVINKIQTADIEPYKIFLEKEYAISNGGHSDKKIAKIIYSIRNSIVHNKSTELHFSFEYKDIIGLIKLLIDKLEPKIIDVINNPANTVLEYEDQKMNLY